MVGDSHLRSFVDCVLDMPPGRLVFAFCATPSGDADDIRKEICHAELECSPDVVCLLAPSNNLTSSRTIEAATKAFERLLQAAVSKWPKVYHI